MLLVALAALPMVLLVPSSVNAGPVNLTAIITAPLKLPGDLGSPPEWKPMTMLNYATYLPGLKDCECLALRLEACSVLCSVQQSQWARPATIDVASRALGLRPQGPP
jgi:hypothetical protein